MGIVSSLYRVSDPQLAELIAKPELIESFLDSQYFKTDGPSGSLDKSVDEIQSLLSAAGIPVHIAPVEMPGEPISYGRSNICFGLSSEKVADIAERLRAVPFDALGCQGDDDDYLRDNYDGLVAFVDDAASRKLGAILTTG